MHHEELALGIDLGTSGVRIAIINKELDLIYNESINYETGLEESKEWESCCKELIKSIPIKVKKHLKACSIDGTSGTLVACNRNGEPISEAIPYYSDYSKEYDFSKEGIEEKQIRVFSSVGRALHLIYNYGSNIHIRHQADWISGWLTNNWEFGEESNNIKLGWDQMSKSWPRYFRYKSWLNALPKIICSGNIIDKIDPKKARELGLPKDLVIVAGTTDSNAAVIAANPSKADGVSILGSTIVLKKYVINPFWREGITNHKVGGKWLCGGSSNAGGRVLNQFFANNEIEELSNQINPKISSGLKLLPLPCKGERFPIMDPNLEPVLNPRPISDSLYLHALFEGLAEIEKRGWAKLKEIGVPTPKKIITIGTGAKNIQWQKIRERILNIPTSRTCHPPAMGVAMIALSAI